MGASESVCSLPAQPPSIGCWRVDVQRRRAVASRELGRAPHTASCGDSLEGSFAHTFVLTDIASGWTECVALLVRESTLVADALDQLRTTMPFPLRGIDSDNGSEFINETLLAYCGRHAIEFTRSRPYRKNDQAWVEQKNGSVVRRLVGYGRLQGLRAVEALARRYTVARLFVNS